MKPRELRLHIRRLVVDGVADSDRAAMAAALAQQVPGAIETSLRAPGRDTATAALHVRIAEAVAERVKARLP